LGIRAKQMAAKKKTRKKRSPNKSSIDDAELAIILSHAETFGAGETAKQFGLSRRTVCRYQAKLKSGKCPEVAQKVATERQAAVTRSRDKLHLCLDKLLDRVMQLAPDASMTEAIEATDKIGGLMVTRQAFGGTDDAESGSGADSPNTEAQNSGGAIEGGKVIKGPFGAAGK